MLLPNVDIRDDAFISAIVASDYRVAGVFRKYGIDYCCGGKQDLITACALRGLDIAQIKKEIADAVRTVGVSGSADFNRWSVDFLADYIINVHHAYLVNNLPEIVATVERFAASHRKSLPYVDELLTSLLKLRDSLLPHLEQEEKIIFPYIRQIAHAYENHEPYAALLVRTLRKPIENMMAHEHNEVAGQIYRIRELTNNYALASNACITQKVLFAMLKELDCDLQQHIHLKSNILFPKAVAMENEMLALK